MSVQHASSKADLDRILGSSGTVVVDFDFPGVNRLDEKFQDLSGKYKDITFVRVNLEGDDKQFDDEYEVTARDAEGGNRVLPVFVIIKDGSLVKTGHGLRQSTIEEWIDRALS